VRGRLAPSPTGRLHLGNAFAFLAACASIRQQNGVLVMRVEDIDPDRSRQEYVAGIIEDLHWLGLDWQEGPGAGPSPKRSGPTDSAPAAGSSPSLSPEADLPGTFGPYVQSACAPLYTAAIARLQGMGLVYPCFCTRKELRSLPSAPHGEDGSTLYPGLCRTLSDHTVRTRMAEGRQASLRLDVEKALALLDESPLRADTPHHPAAPRSGPHDLCLFDHDDAEIRRAFLAGGDFPLMRSDGVVAYQLAVALDDARMRITQVVRGNDLVASTPRQMVLCRLLGYEPPRYWHVPLLCDPLGERLAKRHKGLELCALREMGVPPQAILGLLAHLVGFTPTPLPLSLDEFVRLFRMEGLPPAIVLPHDVEGVLTGVGGEK